MKRLQNPCRAHIFPAKPCKSPYLGSAIRTTKDYCRYIKPLLPPYLGAIPVEGTDLTHSLQPDQAEITRRPENKCIYTYIYIYVYCSELSLRQNSSTRRRYTLGPARAHQQSIIRVLLKAFSLMSGCSIQGIWNLKAKHNAASQISQALGACIGSVPVNLTARANKFRARARHGTTCTVWDPKELTISC